MKFFSSIKLCCYILLMGMGTVYSQKKIRLLESVFLKGLKDSLDVSYQFILKGKFEHKGSILSADTTYFYPNKNIFYAHQNVKINQGDTLYIYSDRLTYSGKDQNAKLRGNVLLEKKQQTLITDALDYNMNTEMGIYKNYGTFREIKDSIKSKIGIYYNKKNQFHFFKNIRGWVNDSFFIGDTLNYFPELKKLLFFKNSVLYHKKKDTILTDKGHYSFIHKKGLFLADNQLFNKDYILFADTIDIDDKTKVYNAYHNIFLKNRKQHEIVKSHRAKVYNDSTKTIKAFSGLHFILPIKKDTQLDEKDSLWIRADTLISKELPSKSDQILKDAFFYPNLKLIYKLSNQSDGGTSLQTISLSNSNPRKKEKVSPDKKRNKGGGNTKDKNIIIDGKKEITTHLDTNTSSQRDISKQSKKAKRKKPIHMEQEKELVKMIASKKVLWDINNVKKYRAYSFYHNIHIYNKQYQGRGDSLYFSNVDSILRMFHKPKFWHKKMQMVADTIWVKLNEKKIDKFKAIKNVFITKYSKLDNYDQIKGKELKGLFMQGALKSLTITGNAESLYHIWDSVTYIGIQRSLSKVIKTLFQKDEIVSFGYYDRPEVKIIPFKKINDDHKILRAFALYDSLRPKNKYIITAPFLSISKYKK